MHHQLSLNLHSCEAFALQPSNPKDLPIQKPPEQLCKSIDETLCKTSQAAEYQQQTSKLYFLKELNPIPFALNPKPQEATCLANLFLFSFQSVFTLLVISESCCISPAIV